MSTATPSREQQAQERLEQVARILFGGDTKVKKQIMLQGDVVTVEDLYDFLVQCVKNGFRLESPLVEPVTVYIERWVT